MRTSRISVIRPAGTAIDLWCDACSRVVPMVAPEDAARLWKSPTRSIYQKIESGELHFTETAGGELLVCTVWLKSDPDTGPGT